MFTLHHTGLPHSFCGNYTEAMGQVHEHIVLTEEKGAQMWKAVVTAMQGFLFVATGRISEGIETLTAGVAALRSTGTTLYFPLFLSCLAAAHAELNQLEEAWSRIVEATSTMEATGERWWEPEVNRVSGEIALKSPEPDAAKAEAYFDHALAVARQQQAKSWELRASMSLARLWRDQGKVQQARELLAPVYGWFTEGFDTLDLKEAKGLLEELAA
jgi:predicted ATPase